MSTPTDDLEAKAREWLNSEGYMHLGLRITKRGHTGDSDMPEQVLATFARSLAQPPSGELVEAARYALGFADSYQCHGHDERYRKEASQVYDKLQKALPALPKEVAPMVEKIMEAIRPHIEMRGGPVAYSDRCHDLRARLTKLLTNP